MKKKETKSLPEKSLKTLQERKEAIKIHLMKMMSSKAPFMKSKMNKTPSTNPQQI